MLEVEKAQADAETQGRLEEMRAQLGLSAGAGEIIVATPERKAIEAGGDTT